MKGFLAFVLQACLALAAPKIHDGFSQGLGPRSELEVQARYGTVIGHYARNTTSVREFLGVPYAQPPVGKLRFQPAEKLKGRWKTPIKADAFGASCLSAKYNSPTLGNSPITLPPASREDEDCLTMNIWAPSHKRLPRSGAAVMLWVYGGGFMIGTSETPLYNGANIVRDQEGVIVVTINRTNVFGFPANPGNNKNVGLTDIRAAVEFVRDNIGAFGGDPKRITLFGQSAGGAATDAYLFTHRKDPIIYAAIPQSGSINSILSRQTVAPGTTWGKLTSAAGCANNTDVLACMQALPALTVRATLEANNLTFGPSPDNNTIFSDGRLQRGQFARVPILLGITDQEIFGNTTASSQSSKIGFTCPAARSATAHAKYGPTWQYRYFGNFPSQVGLPPLGPFHGSEIQNIFGTFNQQLATDEQRATSKYLQKAWITFAKDPKNGLRKLGWPTFDPNKETLIRLSYNNEPKATFVNPAPYVEGCPAA